VSVAPIRVMLVDDSSVVRRVVGDVLAGDPELTVAGTAANGRLALATLEKVAPDVVVLDVEMPELDGLQTLAELRRRRPRLPVIMFSTLTARGAIVTLDALARGASDYVTKPSNTAGIADAVQRVRDELVPRIKALVWRGRPGGRGPIAPPVPRAVQAPVEAIVLGVSTGGPNALATLVPELPADLGVPLLIVQHMPPVFTRFLAERLAARAKVPVVEAQAGMPAEPGHVYVAPGDFHLVVERPGPGPARLRTTQDPPEHSCRPAVDVLFRSAARAYGAGTLGVVLTGMGHDGCAGAGAIRAAGGQVLAQDEASSVVWGMPGAVVEAGHADKVLPLHQLAAELARRAPRLQPLGH